MSKHCLSIKSYGFTLIELMVVVVIIAILAAIAIPSYQEYARQARATQTEQEIQRLAILLDRYKARNFNYKGFSITSTTVALNSSFPYTVTIVDQTTGFALNVDNSTVTGRSWAIKATTTDVKNYNYLLTSTGIRCKNKSETLVTHTSCGTESDGGKSW